MKAVVLVSLLAASKVASADPCSTRAADVLRAHPTIVELCEPCGDRAPGSPVPIASVELRDGEVYADGRGLDPAYVYVRTSEHAYDNLAALAGCAAGVTRRLRVEPATEHGVLIVAEDDVEPPAPPAPVTPPTVVLVTEASSPLWTAVAVGAGGAVLMWTLVAGTLGRRRRMRPRAVELVARE